MGEGDIKPEAPEFITTQRAKNEVAITVRGDPRMKAKRIMQLLPTYLGKDKVKAAWRPNSTQLAVACEKVRRRRRRSRRALRLRHHICACSQDGHCLLNLYSRSSMPKPVEVHNLGPGRPTWLDWDCQGSSLAVMQEGVGIYLWDVVSLLPTPTQAEALCAPPHDTHAWSLVRTSDLRRRKATLRSARPHSRCASRRRSPTQHRFACGAASSSSWQSARMRARCARPFIPPLATMVIPLAALDST